MYSILPNEVNMAFFSFLSSKELVGLFMILMPSVYPLPPIDFNGIALNKNISFVVYCKYIQFITETFKVSNNVFTHSS